MKDYNVTVKVRNNYLLTAMRNNGVETAAELHRLCGVDQVTIGEYLNLKKTPLGRWGDWKKSIVRIADYLNKDPGDLFPPQHISKALERNTAETELSAQELNSILIGYEDQASRLQLPDTVVENSEIVLALIKGLDTLSPRESEVLKMRFGLGNYKEHDLKGIGQHFNVSKERIRQIEAKALRKMRHPDRSKMIKAAL